MNWVKKIIKMESFWLMISWIIFLILGLVSDNAWQVRVSIVSLIVVISVFIGDIRKLFH